MSVIDYAGCGLSDEGILSFLEALNSCDSLTTLDLAGACGNVVVYAVV